MRITGESQKTAAALWDDLEGEKCASISVAPLSCGPPPRAGYVYDYAGEKVASDTPPREALLKIAGFWSGVAESVNKVLSGGKRTIQGLGGIPITETAEKLTQLEQAQLGVAAGGIGAALGAATLGISSAQEKRRFSQVEGALLNDPWFENTTDKSQVREAYALMRRYSPTIARDPIVARSFVRVLVEVPDKANIQTVQDLMDAEKKFREGGQFKDEIFDLRKGLRGGLRHLGFGGGGKKE